MSHRHSGSKLCSQQQLPSRFRTLSFHIAGMSSSPKFAPAAAAAVLVTVGEYAKTLNFNEALLTKVMSDLGGNLDTPADIVMAIPAATLEAQLPRIKQPDGDDPLTPIQQGMVAHFLGQIKKKIDEDNGPPKDAMLDQNAGKTLIDSGVKIKISDVVDQMDENTFMEPTDTERATYRANYKTVTGGTPPLKHTPTGAQLGALLHKLTRGSSPYVDFAIFNPYGSRMSKIRKFTAQVWIRNQLETKHLHGPGSFDDWLDCWNLFRVSMVSLLAASPQVLGDYAGGIKELITLYPSSWGLIWAADETMRSEQWAQLKEELVDAKSWPADRPWDEVIGRTTFGKGDPARLHFWNLHVVYPATQTGGGLRTVQALEGTKYIPSVDGLFTGVGSSSSAAASSTPGGQSQEQQRGGKKRRNNTNRRAGRGPVGGSNGGTQYQSTTHVGDNVDYRNFNGGGDGKSGKGKNGGKGKGKSNKGKAGKGGKPAPSL